MSECSLRIIPVYFLAFVFMGIANPLAAQESKTLDLTFDDLAFDIEIDEEYSEDMLTDEINEMAGKKIKLRGFMHPAGTTQSGNTKFIFVRDNKECCFGPGAALYDCVLVKLKKGQSVDYLVRPFTVEGTFRLKELKIGGRTMAIFRMSNCKVTQ